MPAGVTTCVRSAVVRRREDHGRDALAFAEAARVTSDSGAPARSSVRAHEMEPRSRSPRRNQSSPPNCATDSRAFHALVGTAPATLVVDQARKRVQEAVEVGGDVEPEDLEVVTDVADHGELARPESCGEATREAGAPAPAREQNDPHAWTARSARVRGPTSCAMRSRSASVSTSAASSGISTVAKGACARKRAALPGPYRGAKTCRIRK